MGLCIYIASFLYINLYVNNKLNEIEEVEQINIIAKIISIKEEKDYKDKYIIKILKSNNQENIDNLKLIMYVKKEIEFSFGDIVELRGKFSKPVGKRNFAGFDYSKYLKQSRIYGSIQVEDIKKIGKQRDFEYFLKGIREDIITKIDILYNKDDAEFLKSLLIGKKDGLSEEIRQNFRDANISHVLAISGMHTSYVVISLMFFLNKFIKNKKVKNNILIFILMIFYILTGEAVSCLRACIMTSLMFIANNFNKKYNFYISFLFSFIFILIVNPYNIYNIGMWLSYMGSLGIVLLYPFLKKIIFHKLSVKNIIKERKNNFKIINIIIENFLVTISAQILIFPITIYVFNTISLSFFISNVFISFIIGPILIIGYISVITSYVFFPLSKIIAYIQKILISIIFCISKICADLPFSKIYVSTPNLLYVIGYYFFIIICIYLYSNKKMYMIRLTMSHKFLCKEFKKIFKKIIRKNCKYFKNDLVIYCLILIIIFSNIIKINIKNDLEICFIDVGQGDCTYIKLPNEKNIIVDAGEGNTEKYDYGENVVLPYILDRKINKIDYLIISHADSDHIGGVFAILENIKVDKIFIGIQPQSSNQYFDLIKIAQNKNIEIIYFKGR